MLETVLGVMEGMGVVKNQWGFLNGGIWVGSDSLRYGLTRPRLRSVSRSTVRRSGP